MIYEISILKHENIQKVIKVMHYHVIDNTIIYIHSCTLVM